MAVSFLTPNRTVLLVSDDALYIYTTGSVGVKLIDVVPWDSQNFMENIAEIIVKDCGNKPVLILNDMVEQHYRKERVPKTGVSYMDRAAMLKRRLSVAFGKYPVKASLLLKEKIVKTASQPASDIYIFVAIPETDQLNKSMAVVKKSMAPIVGLCLLPVESADMVKAFTQKLAPKDQKKAVWSIFIGQHQSGNLRQVVTKNGELALTRMSPLSANKDDPESWAAEVYKEFHATMGYLSRFGYDPKEGLDVTVIAAKAAHEQLRIMVGEEYSLNIFDVFEGAKVLGVSIGYQHDPGLADPLHIAWAGRKSKLTLPMKSDRIDKVYKSRQVALAATILLLMGAAGHGYLFADYAGKAVDMNNDIDFAQKRKTQMDSQYQAEVERKESMGFDVQLIQSAISVYEDLDHNDIAALELFKGMGIAMGKDMRVDSVEVTKAKPSAVNNSTSGYGEEMTQQKAEELYDVRLIITYPGTTNIDIGNQEVADLGDRLSKVLKDNEVEVIKLLKDYEYTEGLFVETGDLETKNIQQDFVAEIRIKGFKKQEEQVQ